MDSVLRNTLVVCYQPTKTCAIMRAHVHDVISNLAFICFWGNNNNNIYNSNNHMKTSQMVNFNKVHTFRDTQACKKIFCVFIAFCYSLRLLLLFSQGTPNTVIIRCFSVSSPNVWDINNAVSFINVSGVSSTFTQKPKAFQFTTTKSHVQCIL